MVKNKIRNYQIFSVIFTFVLGSLLHFTYKLSGENLIIAIFVLAFIFVCFIIFTYFTPNIGIFKDPVTGQYGVKKII